MTIHRSQPTSAAAAMPGDFVRIINPHGASYPQVGLGPAVVKIAAGIFGKIDRQGGAVVLVPDERVPALIREIGPMTLSESVTMERISVDQEHEKAIMGLQYLRQIADIARQRAAGPDGTVNRGVLQALLGEAANSDLRKIVDELSVAGVQVVEQKITRTYETSTVFLTTDPQAVRDGRPALDAMKFTSPTKDSTNETFDVFDASRTRELLLSVQPMREVNAQPGEPTLVQPTASTNLINLLGLGGTLSADDVGLGTDFGQDDEESDGDGPVIR